MTIAPTLDDVTLTGVCTDVRIDGVQHHGRAAGATSLTVSGANLEITATGPVGTVTYAGGNNTLTRSERRRRHRDRGQQRGDLRRRDRADRRSSTATTPSGADSIEPALSWANGAVDHVVNAPTA